MMRHFLVRLPFVKLTPIKDCIPVGLCIVLSYDKAIIMYHRLAIYKTGWMCAYFDLVRVLPFLITYGPAVLWTYLIVVVFEVGRYFFGQDYFMFRIVDDEVERV